MWVVKKEAWSHVNPQELGRGGLRMPCSGPGLMRFAVHNNKWWQRVGLTVGREHRWPRGTEPACDLPTDRFAFRTYTIQSISVAFFNFHEKKHKVSPQVELNSKHDKPELAPTLVARINFSL